MTNDDGVVFTRQVFEIEVLSDSGPLENASLEDIAYEIAYGDRSGVVRETVREVVSPKQMTDLLVSQGSDPGFFNLDEDGNVAGDDDIIIGDITGIDLSGADQQLDEGFNRVKEILGNIEDSFSR